MAGTLIIAVGKSLDVRTIDFEWIADALRKQASNSDVVRKLLQSTDEFGMDMICAGELNRAEFKEFYRLLSEIQTEISADNGLAEFIDKVCQAAEEDDRLRAA